MKARLLLVVICLGYAQSIHAQKPGREINILFRAGYVNTSIYGSFVDLIKSSPLANNPSVVNKNGFEISTTFSYQVYKPFFIYTRLSFIQKGGAIDHSNLTYPVDVTLNYLSIPVAVSVRPPSVYRFAASLSVGVLNNFEVSSERDFTEGTDGEDNNRKFTLTPYMEVTLRYIIARQFALQCDVGLMNDHIPFYEWDNAGEHYEMQTRGTTISLGVVYGFRAAKNK
jgi:hypothetical protein